MGNIITLDGIDFSEDCMEIDEIDEIIFALDDTNKIVDKSITSEFTFRRSGFEYIRSKFFDDTAQGCDAIIDVVILLDCCIEVNLEYNLTYEGVFWCPGECEMRTTLERLDTDNKGFNYLNRTRVLDNDVHLSINTPHLEYCSGRAGDFVIAFYNLLTGVLFTINLIIFIINALGGNIPLFTNETLDGLLGCDKQAPGFVVPEMLAFHAAAAGLTFQSTTIYDLPQYDKTTVIAMAFVVGIDTCPDYTRLIENRPNVPVVDFMTSLQPLYGAETRIREGVLIFENWKWIEDNLVNVGNVDDIEFAVDASICYSYDLGDFYAAYGRFQYSYDSVDISGNEVAPHYNDVVEWNPDALESRKGEFLNVASDFSPLMIVGLQLHVWDNDNPYLGLTGHGMIDSGQCSLYKIYQWDGASICKARPIGITFLPFQTSNFNHPYTFIEDQGVDDSDPSLYETFHKDRSPLVRPCPMKCDDFTFSNGDFCGMIETLKVFGTDIYLDSPYGKITPKSITVNLDQKNFTWSECKLIPYE